MRKGIMQPRNASIRIDILGKSYVNITDIQKLLDVPRMTATRIYHNAENIDEEFFREIGRPNDSRVRISSVMKAARESIESLKKRIQMKEVGTETKKERVVGEDSRRSVADQCHSQFTSERE